MGSGVSPAIAPAPQVQTGTTQTTLTAVVGTSSRGVRSYSPYTNWQFVAAHAPVDNFWVEGGVSDVGIPSLNYQTDWSGTPDGSQIVSVSPVTGSSLGMSADFSVLSWDSTPLLRKQSQNNGQPTPAYLTVGHTVQWDGVAPATQNDSSGNPQGGSPQGFLSGTLPGPLLGWQLFGPQSSFRIEQRVYGDGTTPPNTVDFYDTTTWGSGTDVGARVGESYPGTIDWGDGNTELVYGNGYLSHSGGSHTFPGPGVYTVKLTRMAGTQFESVATTTWTIDDPTGWLKVKVFAASDYTGTFPAAPDVNIPPAHGNAPLPVYLYAAGRTPVSAGVYSNVAYAELFWELANGWVAGQNVIISTLTPIFRTDVAPSPDAHSFAPGQPVQFTEFYAPTGEYAYLLEGLAAGNYIFSGFWKLFDSGGLLSTPLATVTAQVRFTVDPPAVVTPPSPSVLELDPPPLYLPGVLHARTDGAITRFDTRSRSRS